MTAGAASAAAAAVTAASSVSVLEAADASSGAAELQLSGGQAALTLAVVSLIIFGALLTVWLRHRRSAAGGEAADAPLFNFSLPSFRRSAARTGGSGVVGSGRERLLGADAASEPNALRNRPGGHSLL
jgi:cytochrome c oxidase assembly factor CtaG